MPSHAAMIDKPKTVSPEQAVEDVLKVMKKQGLTQIPVLDEKKKFLGVFNYRHLMKNLLPVSISVGESFDTQDVVIGAAPGIAKRLRNVQLVPVRDFLEADVPKVYPQTPIWKTVDLIVRIGGPVYVVDEEEVFLGYITEESALEELGRLKDN